jgi:Tol biopolymer transport system component
VKLTTLEQGYDFPKISPDGQWIVYGDFYTLYRIRSDGTKRQRLTPPPYQYARWNPQFSPDSQWILYRWYENGEIVWRRMRADGTSPQTVLAGDASARWWTPPPSMNIP